MMFLWFCVVYQPPQCAVRPSERWDCCRNYRIQAGCNGLHHLDVLLQTAGDEPQVRRTCSNHVSYPTAVGHAHTHTHTHTHSWPTFTTWLEECRVLLSNICCVDGAHSRTFQPVDICTAVSPHLPFRPLSRPPSGILPVQVCGNQKSFQI